MLVRILTVALNAYREAVRARVLLGVFAMALATCAYSTVVATLSLENEPRVVADLGAASMSLYSVLVAVVLGSTSLHRELEYKTIFPILSRTIRRWEYLTGKYVGTLLTVVVFVLVDMACILAMLALEAGQRPVKVVAGAASMLAILAFSAFRTRHSRVFVVIPWAVALAAVMWVLASPSPGERQLVVASSVLAVSEVAIVAAVATLFASFSSPFLTATFTAMIFVIGRSSDTLARLPPKVFGPTLASFGRVLARIFPNLHVYVPARPLLLGEVANTPLWSYVGLAALHAAFYSTAMIAIGTLAFRKRDFA